MGISGNLEDVSVVDVLQIFSLSQKSGVLRIKRENQRVEVGFVAGKIVSASIRPRLMYMSDILVESGQINLDTLHKALQIQRQQGERPKRIGAILVEQGVVTLAQIEDALRSYIQSIINVAASWTEGEFSFDMGTLEPVDGLRFLPDSLACTLELSPQELLLEAMRISDEVRRKDKEPKADGSSARPESGLESDDFIENLMGNSRCSSVVVLSHDLLIRHALKHALKQETPTIYMPASLDEARSLLDSQRGQRTVLIVDTDTPPGQKEFDGAAPSGIEVLEQLVSDYPDLSAVSFGTIGDPLLFLRAINAGVLQHVPRQCVSMSADVEDVKRFVDVLSEVAKRAMGSPAPDQRTSEETRAWLRFQRSLYHDVVRLRRNADKMAVSLEVLRFVARQLDRAVLFLVRGRQLCGLGVFGLTKSPEDFSHSAAKLRIDIPSECGVKRVIDNKLANRVQDLDADPVIVKILEYIGPPARREAIVIPLVVNNQTVGVVYADNGTRREPLFPGDALGVVIEHAGLIMENTLLKRKLKGSRG